jgi:hypothetical protein
VIDEKVHDDDDDDDDDGDVVDSLGKSPDHTLPRRLPLSEEHWKGFYPSNV